MHAPLLVPFAPGVLGDRLGKLDLGRMQVLARDLRQGVELLLHRLVEARIGIAEVDRRIPHLQVEVRHAGGVEEVAALAAREDLRRLDVVDGVAERAIAASSARSCASVMAEGLGGKRKRGRLLRARRQPSATRARAPGRSWRRRGARSPWSRQWSSRRLLAKLRSARPATQKSEAPSPIISTRLPGAASGAPAQAHLQVPLALTQPCAAQRKLQLPAARRQLDQVAGHDLQVAQAMPAQHRADRMVEPVADDGQRRSGIGHRGGEPAEVGIDGHAGEVLVELVAAAVEQRDLPGHAFARADPAFAPVDLEHVPAGAGEPHQQRIGDVFLGDRAVEIAQHRPGRHGRLHVSRKGKSGSATPRRSAGKARLRRLSRCSPGVAARRPRARR